MFDGSAGKLGILFLRSYRIVIKRCGDVFTEGLIYVCVIYLYHYVDGFFAGGASNFCLENPISRMYRVLSTVEVDYLVYELSVILYE